MSLKLKILVGILVVITISAVAVLIAILINDSNKTDISNTDNTISEINSVNESNQVTNSGNSSDSTNDLIGASGNLSDYDSVEFFFVTLNGYWTFNNQFFAFTSNGGKHFVEYGLWATSFGVRGEIKDAKVIGENTFSLTLFISAVPADEMSDAKPERTEIVYVDVSNYKKENRLNVKLDNNTIGDGKWRTYEYGGITLEKAFSDYIF